jgi:hypothetical protein
MALTALGIRLAFEPFRPTGPPCFVCRISVLTQTNASVGAAPLCPTPDCPSGLGSVPVYSGPQSVLTDEI